MPADLIEIAGLEVWFMFVKETNSLSNDECVLDKSLKNVAHGRLERLSDIKMQGKLKI